MPKTSYYTVNGQIIGERTGGVRRNYGVDALGSVTSTIQGSAIENAYAYKPFGETAAASGGAANPMFNWVGSSGYRANKSYLSRIYVRSREYSPALARWNSPDPLALNSPPYLYVNGNPTSAIDSSGLVANAGLLLEAPIPCNPEIEEYTRTAIRTYVYQGLQKMCAQMAMGIYCGMQFNLTLTIDWDGARLERGQTPRLLMPITLPYCFLKGTSVEQMQDSLQKECFSVYPGYKMECKGFPGRMINKQTKLQPLGSNGRPWFTVKYKINSLVGSDHFEYVLKGKVPIKLSMLGFHKCRYCVLTGHHSSGRYDWSLDD